MAAPARANASDDALLIPPRCVRGRARVATVSSLEDRARAGITVGVPVPA